MLQESGSGSAFKPVHEKRVAPPPPGNGNMWKKLKEAVKKLLPRYRTDFLSVLMIKYGMRGGDLWEEVAAREPEVEWGQLEGQL